MKIAVPTKDNTGTEAEVAARFGRAPYFAVIDSETDKIEFITNEGREAASGAGVQAAQLIADEKADILLAPNLGPKAFSGLEQAGLKMYQVGETTVEQAVADYKEDRLSKLEGATKQSHAGLK